MIPALIACLAILCQAPADDPDDTRTPEERCRSLAARYEAELFAFRNAPNDDAQLAARAKINPFEWGKRFLDLAEAFPKTEGAEDALLWIGSHVLYGESAERAKERLLRDHADSKKLGLVFAFQWNTPGSKATEALLRHAAEKSPHREVRGLATYWLAVWIQNQTRWTIGIKKQDPAKPTVYPDRTYEGWGRDFAERLGKLDPEAKGREADELLGQVVKKYDDVPSNDVRRLEKTLGKAAQARLDDPRRGSPIRDR